MVPATGYCLREQNQSIVGEPAWTGVEIDFQRACHPLRLTPYLGGMSFDYVSVHTLDLSVAGPEAPPIAYLDAVRAVAVENGARTITDHLGFTHGQPGGPSIGHVTAPPWTEVALDVTCRNIERLQRWFAPFRFFVENLAHFFRFPGTMPEADFVCRLLQRTGCGLLLDVTNVHANVRNHGIDGRAFIEQVVAAAPAVQMHLAGGYFDPGCGMYIDSHSEPLEDPVWDLYRLALRLGRGKVEAVFIERDWQFPDDDGWRAELRQVRQIAIEESRP
jgi:uncharacterized protein (UPF0276 family)